MTNLAITFTASFLIWIMFFGLIVLWIIDGRIKKEQALHALLATILAWIAAEMIKSLFPVARPFAQNGHSTLVIWDPINAAFPSAHTATIFAMSVTIWFHNRKIGLLYLLSGFLIGVARILANVHYPLDILGGALLGSAVAFIIEKVHVYELIKRLGSRS